MCSKLIHFAVWQILRRLGSSRQWSARVAYVMARRGYGRA